MGRFPAILEKLIDWSGLRAKRAGFFLNGKRTGNICLSARWNAVCVFDDAVEHCGEGAHKYLPACFPSFMDGIKEVRPTVAVSFICYLDCFTFEHESFPSRDGGGGAVKPAWITMKTRFLGNALAMASSDASLRCHPMHGAHRMNDLLKCPFTSTDLTPTVLIL